MYPLLTKRVHHETSLGILRSYALTIQRIDNSEISQCMSGRNFAIDVYVTGNNYLLLNNETKHIFNYK